MSLDAIGLFLFGVFSFLMGHDYKQGTFHFDLSDTGAMMLAVWALIGCFGFIFDWIQL